MSGTARDPEWRAGPPKPPSATAGSQSAPQSGPGIPKPWKQAGAMPPTRIKFRPGNKIAIVRYALHLPGSGGSKPR